ncbi:class F sortase [Streptomyces sp. NPDC087440]|uniref:class F sortase n=1 Tax=Streptomyces sp. NPDC087440 TaxID=3365790 RepID=UPI0037F26813
MFRTFPTHRPRALTALACLFLATSATVSGCAAQRDAPHTGDRPASAAEAVPGASPASPATPDTGAHSRPPVHLSIPSLGVRSEIMRLGLNADGTVEVPPADKGMTTGWYSGGPVPGAPGPAVLIGHNATREGRAVFHGLKRIAQGADIAVRDERGTVVHFEVTGRETVRKNAFPTERVYGATRDRALRLITCDGAFDAQGHPVDNLIVYARRA